MVKQIMLPDSPSSELGIKIVKQLTIARQDLLCQKDHCWALPTEHVLHHLESNIAYLCGTRTDGYLRFLQRNNITKCSFTIADSFRYMSPDDFAVSPELTNAVIAAAQGPVFRAYAHYLDERTETETPALPSQVAPWVQRWAMYHLDSFTDPSRHGNAAVRESTALLHEKILSIVLPSVSEKLSLHYALFLRSKDVPSTYCQEKWMENSRLFDLDATFPSFWLEYLLRLGDEPRTYVASQLDALRLKWSSILTSELLRLESQR